MSLRQHHDGDCWPDLCPWCAQETADEHVCETEEDE